MKKNLYFVFTAASFAFLVSAPGRLVYGIVLLLEFNLLAVLGVVLKPLVKRLDFKNLHDVVTLSALAFAVILYREIWVFISPVIVMTLGFVMYLPLVSLFLLSSTFTEKPLAPLAALKQSIVFSAFAFLFFLLRDVLGYGTITLPAHNSIAEFYIFNSYNTAFLSFFATIPGAMVLIVVCMVAFLYVQYKMDIVERSAKNSGISVEKNSPVGKNSTEQKNYKIEKSDTDKKFDKQKSEGDKNANS